MSLPRQVPSHSSSPSKSSLRRTSAERTRNPSLLPSPHFEEAHLAQQSPRSPHEQYEDAIAGQSTTAPPAPPNFQPFFTLIEDTITKEHFHPTVHYIFADDDTDIITEAACRALETTTEEDETRSQAITSYDGAAESRDLPQQQQGVKEHYLILDVQPTASETGTTYEVANVQSLSSDWQVLRTSIAAAPTIAEEGDEGLMLRIEGRGNSPTESEKKGEAKETMEEMIERFKKGLEEVKVVMEANQVQIPARLEDEDQ